MNRFTRFTTTVFAAIACAGTGALHADTPARPGGSKPAAAGPTVTTYATGLTNPRGLTFGPDGNLYVAEAGVGGGQTPADIDPSCPVHRQRLQPVTRPATAAACSACWPTARPRSWPTACRA